MVLHPAPCTLHPARTQEKEVVLVQSLQLFTRELLTGAETEAGSATLTRTLTPTPTA